MLLVTAALPYANGPLHFGHIAGAYLPADIYTRFQRSKGNRVIFVSGTDEHGTPILVNAEKEKISPKEFVDKWHNEIKQTFKELDIAFDVFSRTTNKEHYDLVQDFFKNLVENKLIFEDDRPQLFCQNCNKGIPDRYVFGGW